MKSFQLEGSPFFAATIEEMNSQLSESVAPGKLELLDALSLSYRGRYEDAVRSSVTAIEVALEARLKQLLLESGISEGEASNRLSETRNSFFKRISEYELLSKKRIPGPVLSIIPYINGLRLRSELETVRSLRHKIVHEGIRIDIHERGPMLRAIETMTWLFEWLNYDDSHGPRTTRNYAFFSSLRGMRKYPTRYMNDGVEVLPMDHFIDDDQIQTSDELLHQQYSTALDVQDTDVELFVRMSFHGLNINCEDGPPPDPDSPLLVPRFLISYASRRAIVFCIEIDGLPDLDLANKVVAAVHAYQQQSDKELFPICIIHHQRHLPASMREVDAAVSESFLHVIQACGLSLITTIDLFLFVNARKEYQWNLKQIRDALFSRGRQCVVPPSYKRIGVVRKFYPNHSVLSVEVCDGEELNVGDTVCYRLKHKWHEESLASLEVDKQSFAKLTGPVRAGIKTTLEHSEVRVGTVVYLRTHKNHPATMRRVKFLSLGYHGKIHPVK